VLRNFSISGGDGQYPNAALVRGSDGALYGTTVYGGDLGFGTVFRLLVTHPPVAVARAIPLVSFSPTDTNRFVISTNNTDASVFFDALQSYDLDNDPLRFFWFEESSLNPFATGVVATNSLSVGSHIIILIASDGIDSGTNRLMVKVITAGQAVEKVIEMVQAAALSDKDAHPLLVTLQAAGESFDRTDTTTGLNQLEVFLRKVRSKVTPNDRTLAEALTQAAQKIIEAFAGI
jgi:uncharacterized repeat protein (TIGR03803 family)